MIDYKNINNDEKKLKKHKPVILKNVGIISSIFLFVSIIFLFFYAYKAYMDNYFKLRNVAISGNRILTIKKIKNIAQTNSPKSMSFYSEKKIYSNLITNPWIKKVSVAKIYPDTIYIKLKEVTPVAALRINKKIYIIDNDGYLISEYKNDVNIHINKLMQLRTKNQSYLNKHSLLNSIFKTYKKLDNIDRIDYIDIVFDSRQLAHFKSGINVVVNSLSCPNKSFDRLKNRWSEFLREKNNLENISICFNNKFVLRWKKGDVK